MRYIIEFGLLEYTFLRQAVQYQFAVTQVIQNRRKVSWITIDEIRTSFILKKVVF